MMKITFIRALFVFLSFVEFAYVAPWVISHRGGGENAPENTLLAFSKSLEVGCDAIELDVQVTKDGVVAVYHPDDLNKWTDGSGPISSRTWEELEKLNAAFKYQPEKDYPFRDKNLHIPRIEEILHQFPKTLIIIDMKSLPTEALVQALIKHISDEESARLLFYSTNAEHIDLLNIYKPHWRTIEKRDVTRQRLLDFNQTSQALVPMGRVWMGFELKRKMKVTETFALGTGTSELEFRLWTPELVSHLKTSNPDLFLVLFGINKEDEWKEAVQLGVDAVFTDNPLRLIEMKNHCEKEVESPAA